MHSLLRKKIFIIHGKGVKDGFGQEGGGDLDTIGSNVFYGAWFVDQFRKEHGADPVYGEHYEFDFVNYGNGIAHLAVHRGCDIYLPDFPIDAMAARLKLLIVKDRNEVAARVACFECMNEIRSLALKNAATLSGDVKSLANNVLKTGNKVLGEGTSIYDITFYSAFLEVLKALLEADYKLDAEGPGLEIETRMNREDYLVDVISLMQEEKLENLKIAVDEALSEMDKELDSFFKGVSEKELLDIIRDIGRYGFIMGMRADLFSVLMECMTLIKTLSQAEKLVTPARQSSIAGARDKIKFLVETVFDDVALFKKGLIDVEAAAAPLEAAVAKLKSAFKALLAAADSPVTDDDNNVLTLMLCEESNGRPVKGIDVTVKTVLGNTRLVPFGKTGGGTPSITVPTDTEGAIQVSIVGARSDYLLQGTYDNLNTVYYPETVEVPEEILTGDIIETASEGGETSEELPEVERAQLVGLKLVEEDFRFLAENDVYVRRIDDHHPYTPVILQLLERLKDEGLIEHIKLSSLPRGQEEPPDKQKCGADLIYEQLIQGKEADNDGMTHLRYLAHVQDLHLEENDDAINISKLIGSGYSKIAMVRRLAEIKSLAELNDLIANEWMMRVKKYENGLAKVLPRLEKCMERIHLITPRPDGDYTCNLGLRAKIRKWFSFLFMRDEKQRLTYIKDLYASQPDNSLRVMAVLSPFTDVRAGETKINVASAINYLKTKYTFDYFFYCYGSSLMTMRKFTERELPLDLSMWSQFVGSKSDGGHAAAATCKPGSNPKFPQRTLEKINDLNFPLYASYLGTRLSDHLDLELYQVQEPSRKELEKTIAIEAAELESSLMEMIMEPSGGNSGTPVRILAALAPTGGRMTFPLAMNHINNRYQPDYLFFCRGSSGLAIRKMSPRAGTINMEALVGLLGTEEDHWTDTAATLSPAKNPAFPRKAFQFVNDILYIPYLEYVGKLVEKSSQLKLVSLQEMTGNPYSPLQEATIQRTLADGRLITLSSQEGGLVERLKGGKLKVAVILSPFTDREKGEPRVLLPLLAHYVRKKKGADYLFLCKSAFNIAARRLNPSETFLDLKQLANEVGESESVISEDCIVAYPQNHTHFPMSKFRRVNRRNIEDYTQFLATKTSKVCRLKRITVTKLSE